jgi:hypothetical protein
MSTPIGVDYLVEGVVVVILSSHRDLLGDQL